MPSLVYNRGLEHFARGQLDFDTNAFKVMLVTSAYTPDKDAHDHRNDVTNEVVGAGYTSGGVTTSVTVTLDTANDRVDVTFGAVSWPTATITARAAVIYRDRGGAASADELIAFNEFPSDVTSTGGTFSLAASTFRMQN